MTIRATPLLVAPDDSGDDMIGKSMTSDDLIKGLRRINNNLVVPEPEDQYRTAMFKGITALYLGRPMAKGTTKICAFHLGMIPEWTLLDDDGVMISRGWRAIFWKVEKSGACRRESIERQFKVSLDHVTDSTLCKDCVKQGVRELHNLGKRRMCNFHDDLFGSIQQGKRDAPELKNEAGWEQTKVMFT